jgi:peptide/nickel transport system substrate-binding protein
MQDGRRSPVDVPREAPRYTRGGFLTLAVRPAVLAGTAGLITACGPGQRAPGRAQQQTGGPPRRGGHLTMAMNGQVKRWDPAIATVVDESIATQAIYNNLTWLDENLRPQPDLAESWSAGPDLMTWTFKLRQGVRFHHGKLLTADDVVFTFERLLDPATKAPARSTITWIERIEKQDDHTVVFRLNAPNADVPTHFGFYYFRIVPSDRTPEQIAEQPSGTGPFKLKEWSPGERVVFTRNEQYWQPGLPYLDGWTMVSMPEETSRIGALTGRAIDIIWQLTAQSLPALQGNLNIAILRAPSGNYQPLVMKADTKPFDDVRVRQAFKAVVDREAFTKAVTQGYGKPAADHPIPEFMLPELAKEVPIPRRDLARARQLLAQAGYPDGLEITLYTSDGRPGMVESAVTFQEMARPAGIRVNIQKIPISTYWDEIWMKKPFCVSNWITRPTIDNVLSTIYHSQAVWNEGFWRSAEMDRLIEQARAEPDAAKRAAIYIRAAKLIQQEGHSVIAYFRDVITAASKRVRNYTAHPLTLVDLRAVWLEG